MPEPRSPVEVLAPAPDGLQVLPVTGLPDFRPGDDLAAAIDRAAPWIVDGDVLLVTSKVLSKTEGRLVPSPSDPVAKDALRRKLSTSRRCGWWRRSAGPRWWRTGWASSPRPPASTPRTCTPTRSPCCRRIRTARPSPWCAAFADRGRRVGVVVTDTQGRAWRMGVTDVAIGAAGIRVLDDHRGGVDEHGNELVVTMVAVGDELAAAADLVKGKLSGVPVAVVRGLAAPGLAGGAETADADGSDADDPLTGGGRRLIRPLRRGPVPSRHRSRDRAGPRRGPGVGAAGPARRAGRCRRGRRGPPTAARRRGPHAAELGRPGRRAEQPAARLPGVTRRPAGRHRPGVRAGAPDRQHLRLLRRRHPHAAHPAPTGRPVGAARRPLRAGRPHARRGGATRGDRGVRHRRPAADAISCCRCRSSWTCTRSPARWASPPGTSMCGSARVARRGRAGQVGRVRRSGVVAADGTPAGLGTRAGAGPASGGTVGVVHAAGQLSLRPGPDQSRRLLGTSASSADR